MKLLLVNIETDIILEIEDAPSDLIFDPSPSWEETYYITSVDDYSVGDVYKFD